MWVGGGGGPPYSKKYLFFVKTIFLYFKILSHLKSECRFDLFLKVMTIPFLVA